MDQPFIHVAEDPRMPLRIHRGGIQGILDRRREPRARAGATRRVSSRLVPIGRLVSSTLRRSMPNSRISVDIDRFHPLSGPRLSPVSGYHDGLRPESTSAAFSPSLAVTPAKVSRGNPDGLGREKSVGRA